MILRHMGLAALAGGGARVFTVAVPIFIARAFGIGPETDAFFLAAAIILFWTVSIAPVLETNIATVVARHPAAIARRHAIGAGLRTSAAAAAVAGVLLAASTAVPESAVDARLLNQVQWLFAELSPVLLLGTWSSILAGWLNAHRRFVPVAASPVFIGISVLSCLILFRGTLGVHALVVGYLAGEAARLCYLLAISAGTRVAKSSSFGERNSGISSRGLNLQWAGAALIALNPLVDRLLAGGLTAGSVSVIELMDRVLLIPGGIMAWAILPVLTTYWARLAGRKEAFTRNFRFVLVITLCAGAGIAGFLALVHRPMFTVIFDVPGAPWPSVGNTAFLLLLPGLPFQLAGLVLWRAAVVIGCPARLLLAAGTVAFALNLAGDIMVIDRWGLAGLTFVTSLTFMLYCALLWKLCLARA